ncbi:lipocalin family protein [Flavobacterium sp. FlaQc-52]|jgi:hypothetical protein|uniref:lipocalin family protein n=1 Tax=Flavobacterium sp. FlaQc-52 TaxID=3374185 RepID=UPI00375690A4
MKSLNFKTSFLTLFFFLILISCSKDNDNEKVSDATFTIEAFRSQLITIDLKDTNLLMDEYDGVFGNALIKLTKSAENKLLLFITNTTPIGLNKLTIPALANKSILIDVKEVVLTETPEKTLEGFIFNFNQSSQKLDDSQEGIDAKKNISRFTSFLTNASLEEKRQLAILYKVNQSLFDNPFYDTDNLAGKNILNQLKLIISFDKNVLLIVPAVWMIYAGETLVKLAGVALAAFAVYNAIKAHKRFQTEALNSIDADLREAEIIKKRESDNTNTPLNLLSNNTKTVTINTRDRILITSDKNNSKPVIINLFKSQDSFNNSVNKMNTVILWLNQNIPTINYSLFKTLELPSNGQIVLSPADLLTFKNFKFSINHPNLILKSASYQSIGKMDLNIEITGTPSTTPITSTLNYTYDDEFSTFSGSLPINVNKSLSILGSWKWKSFTIFGNPAQQDACELDDIYSYLDNGILQVDEGPLKCSPEVPQIQTGIYTLANDKLTIQINGDPESYLIRKLNETTLELESENTSKGEYLIFTRKK